MSSSLTLWKQLRMIKYFLYQIFSFFTRCLLIRDYLWDRPKVVFRPLLNNSKGVLNAGILPKPAWQDNFIHEVPGVFSLLYKILKMRGTYHTAMSPLYNLFQQYLDLSPKMATPERSCLYWFRKNIRSGSHCT